MSGTIKDRLVAWQRQLTARIGGDISTPEARKAAMLHYNFVDHGFLRVLWRNLHQIGPGVYRSNQPSAAQLAALHDKVGLKAVLNLRGTTEQSFYLFEAETCQRLGITMADLSLSASQAPSKAKLEALYDLLQTLPRPLLIHCKSGADRTGLAAVMYLMAVEKQPFAVARRQLSFRYLHIARSPAGIQDHILRQYEAALRTSGIGFMDWVRGAYDPVAITASFAGWQAGMRSLGGRRHELMEDSDLIASNAISARRLFTWLWRDHLRRHMPPILLAVLFMAIEGASVGALSYLVRPMFDGIHKGADMSVVYWVAFAVAGVFVTRALAGFSHRVLMGRQSEKIAADMQEVMLSHVMRLDLAYFLKNSPGNLMEQVRGDSNAVKALWPLVLQSAARDSISLLSLLTVAVLIDWRWTLIAVVGVPIILGPLTLLQRQVRATARQSRVAASILSTRLDEAFHGIRTLQLTGTEPQETARYRRALNIFLRAQIHSLTASSAIPALIDFVAACGFAGVMLYGGAQIVAGDKTLGAFMSFFTAMALVFEPLRRLGSVSAMWASARVSLERMRELLDVVATLQSPPHPLAMPSAVGGVRLELRDVGFAYDDLPVLEGVTLIAEPGKTTALVGPSGAGKTTVFHLLSRMADPQMGQVLLGGVDLRDLDLRQLRQQFSVVSQDSALFDEPLSANIRLGAPDQSDAALARALHDANAAEFVDKLTLGVETPAGPRGSALSGGQRQRIAIARAVLRNAPVLLLDEATSALDSQSEKLVTDALARLSQGRTTLVIAHRLSTILKADKIVVLNKGRVVDQGTHQELVARGGLYADLYRLQFKD